MKKLTKKDLWTIICIHLIYEQIKYISYFKRIAERADDGNKQAKLDRLEEETNKTRLSILKLKSLPIPFEVRDYCLHLENMWKWKGRYGQYLGSLRYQGTIGFLTYLFPSICDMQLYLHSRLPMMVDLKYTADDKSGVSFITDGKVILNISIEGEISFKDNEIAAGFLLFLNDAFGSGNIPSHEQFMNEDFSRFLN